MKFPLRARPFPRVSLSPRQCDAYESLLDTVVNATLEERERFVRQDKRVLDKKLWKAVKQRDDISVFKRVGGEPPVTRGRRRISQRQPAENYHWRMPKLVAVGTIAGVLDDIMYGIVSPDAASAMVKTSYVENQLVDSAVLHKMRGATSEDPFQFAGLKWIVKAHSPSLNTVAWPRDFVFVESTGVRTFRDGSRMGYHAMHSVDLPQQCPSLESQGILRGKHSSCYLYFQQNPGTVEVYMMSYVEPGGNAPEKFAVLSAANTMIGIWKSVWCAQNKMLAYLLTNKTARRKFRAASSFGNSVPSSTCRNARNCNLCTKSFRSFRTEKGCQLCSALVCSKCRVSRKISFCDESLQLTQRVVEVCKSCIAHVAVADTFSAATDQYVAASIEEVEPLVHVPKWKTLDDEQPKRPRYYSTESSATLPTSLRSLGDFGRVHSWRDEDDVDELQYTRPRDTSGGESVFMETIDDWEQERESFTMLPSPLSSPVYSMPSSARSYIAATLYDDDNAMPSSTRSYRSAALYDGEPLLDHQQRLMQAMQSLCVTAEQTYLITSSNASRVRELNVSTRSRSPTTLGCSS